MTFPAFIPETVIILAVAVKTDVKPIFVWRIPFLFLYIFESPKAAPYMIKNAVQDNFYFMFMEILADIGKVFVRSETAVDILEIPCIVSMIV